MSNKNIASQIIFSMSDEGEFFIDMNIEDYGDDAIENFARMISSLGTMQIQLEALQMATSGILESIPDKVEPFVAKIAELTTLNQCSTPTEEEEGEGDEDKPCIQPSDLF
jgi:hypothetical protein